MNNQEFVALVEDAIKKFEKQNAFSRSNTGGCFYLSQNGNCCIVGHMMSNDEVRLAADSHHEGETAILSLYDNGFEWAGQFTRTQIESLRGLQLIHDAGGEVIRAVQEMRNHLTSYRKQHNV